MTNSPLIINPNDDSESFAVIFGVPFDSTHSYKPGCFFNSEVMFSTICSISVATTVCLVLPRSLIFTVSRSIPKSGWKISILLNASRIALGPKRQPGL